MAKPTNKPKKSLEMEFEKALEQAHSREQKPFSDYDEQIDQAIWKQRAARYEDTLRRFAAGTYGICEKCHKPINPDRLKAWPFATTCIACTEKK